MYPIVELIIQTIFTIIFGYALLFGVNLAKKMYGGKFTIILPSLIGVISILFIMQTLRFIFVFTPLSTNISFSTSLQVMQIIAGFLLLNMIYQLYQIGFATSGIFGGKSKWKK